jgi:ligand-binding sensor domain-containing protein
MPNNVPMNKTSSFLLICFHWISICAVTAQSKPDLSTEHLKTMSLRSIGPGAMSGRITSLAVDPTNPKVIYAGAASGGVWRSKSAGTAWEPIFDKAPTLGIGSIAINPKNPEEIWVGTGEGNPRNSQRRSRLGMYGITKYPIYSPGDFAP